MRTVSLTPGDSLDDRLGEVVVHTGVVGSLLLAPSTGNTHRKSNVGGLEGGAIVRAFFRSTDNLTKSLAFWGPGRDLETRGDLDTLLWTERMENRPFHDDVSVRVDTALSGNRLSGECVVSSAHPDCNACLSVTATDAAAAL